MKAAMAPKRATVHRYIHAVTASLAPIAITGHLISCPQGSEFLQSPIRAEKPTLKNIKPAGSKACSLTSYCSNQNGSLWLTVSTRTPPGDSYRVWRSSGDAVFAIKIQTLSGDRPSGPGGVCN